MAKLIIAGLPHELLEESITIGRAPDNVIQIDDVSVSGHHARLDAKENAFELTDIGSTNGTFVNGQPISTITLRAADHIRFGKVEARLAIEDSAGAQPLPIAAEAHAAPAQASARPTSFANASPFPSRKGERDPARVAIMAAAAVALLAFVASVIAVLMMQPPPM